VGEAVSNLLVMITASAVLFDFALGIGDQPLPATVALPAAEVIDDNCREVLQLYEHALTQGLTPSLELMTKAAVAYARTADSNKFFDRSNKKALRLMDSLTLQGYQPTDPAERIAWGRTYVNAQRCDAAAAVLQEPMRSNTTQEHIRYYYLCNIYTHTGDMAALECIVRERKGQWLADLAFAHNMRPRENATTVEEYTYRVVMFAYSGDIKSALAEIGHMQDSSIVPTQHQYKALKCACKLNDRLDLLPLINMLSAQ
jgi:hypothetical protein